MVAGNVEGAYWTRIVSTATVPVPELPARRHANAQRESALMGDRERYLGAVGSKR